MLEKQVILNIKNVYTANAFVSGSHTYIGAGSETEGLVQVYDMFSGSAKNLERCPGGMMSFVPVPDQPGNFVSVMGLFPPFLGKEAGLFFHEKQGEGWKSRRAFDLPFAHRCEFLPNTRKNILIAASVSKYKENPADWSQPGELYAVEIAEDKAWKARIFDSSIFRNHGMGRYIIDGEEELCVSGAQGVFSLQLDQKGSIKLEPLFHKEVSELSFIDLDGDGLSELITIEPFHGNVLNIYKRIGGDWKLKFSSPLSFGHGLSSGFFNGSALVVVGNRRDSMDLESFTVDNIDTGAVNKTVIETEVGPTQTQVFSYNKKDYILSANQKKNEVALYST